MIILVVSEFGFIEPLKDKKGETVAKAFERVFKIRKPEKVWSDKGKEFYNKSIKGLFEREKAWSCIRLRTKKSPQSLRGGTGR